MEWISIDDLLTPIDEEILVRYGRQGNVKQLVSWDSIHKRWEEKGTPILSPQWTHWMRIPK